MSRVEASSLAVIASSIPPSTSRIEALEAGTAFGQWAILPLGATTTGGGVGAAIDAGVAGDVAVAAGILVPDDFPSPAAPPPPTNQHTPPSPNPNPPCSFT